MRWLHRPLRTLFPAALWRGDPARREIALTFDDGPDASSTPLLVARLAQLGVTATFFLVGERAAQAPELVRCVMRAGHQVGLHGYDHGSFLGKSTTRVLDELAATQALLAEAGGCDPATLRAVRPPFGHFTPAQLGALLAAGYRPTMWTLVPLHWLQPAQATLHQVLTQTRGGDLLVLHEALPGPPVTDLVAAIVPQLLARGYRFVTVEEMWAARREAAQDAGPALLGRRLHGLSR